MNNSYMIMKKKIPAGNNLFGLHIVFILSVLVWVTLPISKVAGQPPGEEASPVVVERVISNSVRPTVSLIGTAKPHRKSVVSPEIEGVVAAFPVKKGQKIKKGEVLARVETRPFLLELKFAKANLAEEKVNHENAISELKRVTELFKKKSISSRSYDDAFHSANALEKRILGLEARIETIQYHIEKCVIKAPFGGFVVEEHTQVGQWLKKGAEIVTIVEIDPILVTTPVPDRYIHFIKVGQKVDLEFDFLPGNKTRKGLVRDIIPEGNEKARTFPVQISVANSDFSILSGMSCRVSFPVGSFHKSLLVNKDAVVTNRDGHQIFVVQDGKALLVPVKKRQAHGSLVVVEGRMAEGDMVVVEGNERLRSGQKVNVIATSKE
ncbi:MAG: efflux RND transporter periplasmic adaptor subunit [Desulfobacteraceae bacterium]|nr:MAG: efflux RND transporter periplasmic adaptor subunit [Desulfobacteraceae bacterium]